MESGPSPEAQRLPGIGEQIELSDVEGRPLRVVRRRGGEVEIRGGPGILAELDPASAQVVGAFLAGHGLVDLDTARRLADAVGSLRFDWVALERGDHAVDRSIADLGIRRRTGVSIVAVLRRPVPLVDPDPKLTLHAGDELVVLCRPEDREAFVRYVRDGT